MHEAPHRDKLLIFTKLNQSQTCCTTDNESRNLSIPDVSIRPGKTHLGSGRARAPVPRGGPASLPLVHVQVLLQRATGRPPLLARPGARGSARLPRRLGEETHFRAPGQR